MTLVLSFLRPIFGFNLQNGKISTLMLFQALFLEIFPAAIEANTPHIKSQVPNLGSYDPVEPAFGDLSDLTPQHWTLRGLCFWPLLVRSRPLAQVRLSHSRAGCRGCGPHRGALRSSSTGPHLHCIWLSQALTCPHCGQKYTGPDPHPTACLALLSLTATSHYLTLYLYTEIWLVLPTLKVVPWGVCTVALSPSCAWNGAQETHSLCKRLLRTSLAECYSKLHRHSGRRAKAECSTACSLHSNRGRSAINKIKGGR